MKCFVRVLTLMNYCQEMQQYDIVFTQRAITWRGAARWVRSMAATRSDSVHISTLTFPEEAMQFVGRADCRGWSQTRFSLSCKVPSRSLKTECLLCFTFLFCFFYTCYSSTPHLSVVLKFWLIAELWLSEGSFILRLRTEIRPCVVHIIPVMTPQNCL